MARNFEEIKENASNIKFVTIYCDGACSGNPGKGGWGTILSCNGKEVRISGAEEETTNNRMELTAVIEGLKKLKKPCNVKVITDSRYVCDAFNKNWIFEWQRNGWKNASKKPVKNIDLWESLLKIMKPHAVSFEWVKGHNGHPYNEECDKMATDAIKTLKEVA